MSNPYWPYWVSDTLNFTYEGENVWGTILGFGDGFVTMITKNGRIDFEWNKMMPTCLYQCRIDDLIMNYERHGNMDFEYLYNYYGPSKPTVQWSMD